MVFLLGPPKGGKSTLLKLLGGELLPDPQRLKGSGGDGVFFVPSHLRVLHVTSTPLFFDGSLLTNLTFGADGPISDRSLDRVRAICEALGVDGDVLCHLDDGDLNHWSQVFSATQCQQLSLARAVVANPEVLCVHKPAEFFPDQNGAAIMRVFRKYVDENGVLQQGPKASRRPRTFIATVVRHVHHGFADQIFWVSPEGVREIVGDEHMCFAINEMTEHH